MKTFYLYKENKLKLINFSSSQFIEYALLMFLNKAQ